MALAACSSKSGGATTSASNSTGTQATTGDIVVGGIQDGEFPDVQAAFNARIARFNAAGGLNGRKVRLLTVLNDGGSATTDLSDLQQLVLKDKVFAIVPYGTVYWAPASTTFLEQQNIPYIGWAVAGPQQCEGDGSFPIDGCLQTYSYVPTKPFQLLAQYLGKKPSQLRIAFISNDVAGGASTLDPFTAATKKLGWDVVYSQATVPLSTTNYSPYVQALLAAKPDVIYSVTVISDSAGLSVALKQAGFKGTFASPTSYLPGVLEQQKQLAEALGGTVAMAGFPPAEENTAVTRQMESDLKAAGDSTNLDYGAQIGWLSADEFIQELQATAKAGPVTSANFIKTIHAGFTYVPQQGGFTDITFPLRQLEPSTCWGLLTVNLNATYTVKEPFSCDPAAMLKLPG
jgi:branched-chain amino acid transport system substrate-binding protein